ncbi:hypothetical protein CKO09_11800 [Chromatium weissei]|nr:hypothetical protein [Chromatium weissei]
MSIIENTILPYEHEGGWFSMHRFHYASAYRSLHEFQSAHSAVATKTAALEASVNDMPPELLSSFICHETMDLRACEEQAFVSSILFSCMTVEAFINNYGVRRLGETYFRQNLERLGITEKFSLLLLACQGIAIPSSDPTLLILRAMFDARNQLVHPKAREFDVELLHRKFSEPPMKVRISTHFEHMEAVISRFCSLDDHIYRDFEFQKPKGFAMAGSKSVH